MSKLIELFSRFENNHYTAVKYDTELGQLDYDDIKWGTKEKKSKLAWEDCKTTRDEFLTELRKIEND